MDSQLTLTHHIEPFDKYDEFLINEVLMIVQNSNVLPVVSFWSHTKFNIEKADEKFFEKVYLAITALHKANAHRRNYHKIKEDIFQEIKNSSDIQNTNVDILFNKVDAFVIIEGFLTQIKTSLDLLAQSLKPIFNQDFRTWERSTEQSSGKVFSGMKLVKVLSTNLPDEIKPHALPLIEYIKENAEYITQVVENRDAAVHYGKNNKIQGFRYSVEKKDVFYPMIKISETEARYVHQYMDVVMESISNFTQTFVIIILSNLLNDMHIAKNSDGSWGYVKNG